jgi:predicted alpha/beta hydrolase
MKWKILLLAGCLLPLSLAHAQLKVSIPSRDGIQITADLYGANENAPYVLLFHQAGSSRGEFSEIAGRIVKIGYNCLAVDLRSGDEINYVRNETSLSAREKGLPTGYLDAWGDIRTAIGYAWNLSKKQVVLLGSSYSASLCLVEGKENPNVMAVIAFSPGEYFGQKLKVGALVAGIEKPIFCASTIREYAYMEQLLKGVGGTWKTLWKPAKGKARHGASMLWESSDVSDEAWLSLMLFFRSLKNE